MARCDLKLYKNVIPKVRITELTSNQQAKLSNLDENRKKFFMNNRVYGNEEEKKVMEAQAYLMERRLESKTDLGITMDAYTNQKYLEGIEAAKNLGLDKDALDLGAEVLLRVRKGEPMSAQERALALPAFLKRLEGLPLLTKQYQQAYASGDEEMIARYGAEIAQSIAMFAGVRGDQNALSVGFNTYKYMYKQIQDNAKIVKLFQNGDC